MARIEHVALWTRDVTRLCDFYVRHFGARAGAPYRNERNDFDSCFLEFEGGARLEVMRTGRLALAGAAPGAQRLGLTHLAIAVGSEERVDALTHELAAAGHPVLDGPRRTGDGPGVTRPPTCPCTRSSHRRRATCLRSPPEIGRSRDST